jgi:hypothetical protein
LKSFFELHKFSLTDYTNVTTRFNEKEKEKSKKERIRVYLIGVWNQAPCD